MSTINKNNNKKGNGKVLPLSSTRMATLGARFVLMEPKKNNEAVVKNPFVIGKTINKNAGKPLEVRSIRSGTCYLVKCESMEQANKLLKVTQLVDNTTVTVELHKELNTCRCVVFCKEAIEMTEAEILEELKPQGVVEVKRITKKVDGKVNPTPLTILTLEGTVVPEHLYLGETRVRTRAYFPSPLQCFNCFRFGHIGKTCKSNRRCSKCSQELTNDEHACVSPRICINCKDDHTALDKKCPVYKKEAEIIKIKVSKGISFHEAKRQYSLTKSKKPSYAEVVNVNERLEKARNEAEPPTSAQIDFRRLYDASRKEVEVLKAQIAELTKKITDLTKLLAAKPMPPKKPTQATSGRTTPCSSLMHQLDTSMQIASDSDETQTIIKRFLEPERESHTIRKKKKKSKEGSRSGSEINSAQEDAPATSFPPNLRA